MNNINSQQSFATLSDKLEMFIKENECSICMELGGDKGILSKCQHVFCTTCIDKILSNQNEAPCPLCRTSFTKKNPENPSNPQENQIIETKICKIWKDYFEIEKEFCTNEMTDFKNLIRFFEAKGLSHAQPKEKFIFIDNLIKLTNKDTQYELIFNLIESYFLPEPSLSHSTPYKKLSPDELRELRRKTIERQNPSTDNTNKATELTVNLIKHSKKEEIKYPFINTILSERKFNREEKQKIIKSLIDTSTTNTEQSQIFEKINNISSKEKWKTEEITQIFYYIINNSLKTKNINSMVLQLHKYYLSKEPEQQKELIKIINHAIHSDFNNFTNCSALFYFINENLLNQKATREEGIKLIDELVDCMSSKENIKKEITSNPLIPSIARHNSPFSKLLARVLSKLQN